MIHKVIYIWILYNLGLYRILCRCLEPPPVSLFFLFQTWEIAALAFFKIVAMLKNEPVANQMLSRWYCMLDSNLKIYHQFYQDPQHHWQECSSKPWLLCILQMAVDTHCISLLTFSIYTDDNLSQTFSVWIHPCLRPVATDFQSSPSVTWHTSVFSPYFYL